MDLLPRQPPKTFIFGQDRGRGNLLGVQPVLTNADYRSALDLTAALNAMLEAARTQRLLNERTVVLFPEYVGFYLYFADEWRAVYEANSLGSAAFRMLWDRKALVSTRWLPVIATLSVPRIFSELLGSKAADVAESYSEVFGSLASFFGITVVGGTVPLPKPRVVDGRVAVPPGARPMEGMESVCAVFRPDGTADPRLVVKAHPIFEESIRLWMKPGTVEALPTFETPAGRMGVLICADAWYPEAYRALDRPDFVLVPSYTHQDRLWLRLWHGYSLAEGDWAPDDVDERDLGAITLGQAWRKYALLGRLPASGCPTGLMTCLRGNLWGDGSDGHPMLVVDGQPRVVEEDGPLLVNVWL